MTTTLDQLHVDSLTVNVDGVAGCSEEVMDSRGRIYLIIQ